MARWLSSTRKCSQCQKEESHKQDKLGGIPFDGWWCLEETSIQITKYTKQEDFCSVDCLKKWIDSTVA